MATPPPRYSDEADSQTVIEVEALMASKKGDIEEGRWENGTPDIASRSGSEDDDVESDVPLDDLPVTIEIPKAVSVKEQIFGYAILLVALFGVSSMGMVALMVEGVPPALVGSWRAQATAMLMIPMFAYQLGALIRAGTLRGILTWSTLLHLGVCAVGGALWGGLFFLSLNYTSLAHAYLFDNLLCIIVVGYKLIRRQPTSWLELGGTGLGVLGAALALVGGADDGIEREIKWVIIGDAICIIGSFGGLAYLHSGKQLRNTVPLFVYMFPLSIVTATIYYILSLIFETSVAGAGVFTWLTPQFIGVSMYLGIVTGFLGYVGYIACLKYVPAIVVTVVMLLEPVLGAAMGVIFGVTGMLDIWTIIGGAILFVGTVMVTWASLKKPMPTPGQQGKLKRGASILLHRAGTTSLKLFAPFTPRFTRKSGYTAVSVPMEEIASDVDHTAQDGEPALLYSVTSPLRTEADAL